VQFTAGLTVLAVAKMAFDLGTIAWFTDRVDYGRVGRVIGLIESAWAIGLFTGVVLMGLLTGLTSWRWGYVLAIVAIAVMAAVLRRRLPDEPARPKLARGTPSFAFHLGSAWWVIAATVGLTASAQAVFVTFGTWLQDDFDFSDTKLAVVIFGLGGFELLASLGSAGFADRWGKQRSTMYAAGAMIPAVGGLAVLHGHLPLGLALLGLFIVSFEFAIVSTLSLSNGLVPSNPSAGLGMMVGGATLGRAAMAPLATWAFAGNGMWLPATLGAGCASTTLLCHARYRAIRPREVGTARVTASLPTTS
jgi:predicted MFS family arabinose efflux permease